MKMHYGLLAGLLTLNAHFCSFGIAAAGEVAAVSKLGTSHGSGGGGSYAPRFSADGNSLLFLSHANNISPDKGGRYLNLYLLNLTNHEVKLVGAAPVGNLADGWIAYPSTSSNGHSIVF